MFNFQLLLPGFIMYKKAHKTIHISVSQRNKYKQGKASAAWFKAYFECLKEKRPVSIIKQQELERLLW